MVLVEDGFSMFFPWSKWKGTWQQTNECEPNSFYFLACHGAETRLNAWDLPVHRHLLQIFRSLGQHVLLLKCPKRPSFALITVIGVQARHKSEVGAVKIRVVLGCYSHLHAARWITLKHSEFQPLEFLRGHVGFSIFLTDSTAGI